MTRYSIKNIASIVNGSFSGNGNKLVKDIVIDSRTIVPSKEVLFVALTGENYNGHDFVSQLSKAGVKNFLLSEDVNIPSANIIHVTDTLQALQKIAAYHRNQFNIKVIGITGSNGKTTVKEWLFQLLRFEYNISRSPKSYNSQVGVPLSVLQLEQSHDLVIYEAGISTVGEMEKLQKILQPDIGIITNIGAAHSEGFIDDIEKLQEKLKLFSSCKTIVFKKNNKVIAEQIKEFPFKNKPQFIAWEEDEIIDNLPFCDEASKENACHCVAVMRLMNYADDVIKERIALLSTVAMRLEMIKGKNHCTIINDSYNADITSLEIALNSTNQYKENNPVTLILSDILQDKTPEIKLYQRIAEIVKSKGVKRFIGIGKAISKHKKIFSGGVFYNTTNDFLTAQVQFSHEIILLKGARKFEFEKISSQLQQQHHATVMEINVKAVINNFNYFKSLLQKKVKMMVMVKAFSYGSGKAEVAKTLTYQGVDYMGVAYADEGTTLRNAGITTPIMVMNPEKAAFAKMIHNKLEPEIFSLTILDSFIRALIDEGKKGYPIHLKIDTGMHRLGFGLADIPDIIAMIKAQPEVRVASIFTHLSAVDDPNEDEYTEQQIATFNTACKTIAALLDYPILRHVLNSSGIIRHPEHAMDMVRLGIGLYGVNPVTGKSLEVVHTLKSTISQITTLNKGESVGYGRGFFATKPMQIATIPVGYADGYSRRLSNGKGKLFVNGKFAPVVGNICMDMCMIDVTDIIVNEGDVVEIFGSNISISEVAQWMNTVPYEVLTSVSQRVKRIFVSE